MKFVKQLYAIRPWFLLFAVLTVLLTSCVTTENRESIPAPAPVFPPDPEQPRFIYEMTLFSNAQMRQRTAETNWRMLLTGEREGAGLGLAKPYDVVACKGRVYISDTVARLVHVFDFQDMNYFQIGIGEEGGLRKPLGMNTDADCNLYVADGTLSAVLVYTATGKYKTAIGGSAWFNMLSHVAVTADGSRIFAIDTGGVQNDEHRIRIFDTASGEHLYDIGERGRAPGKFNLLKDIEIGVDGNLYVVDSGNFRVQVLSPEGEFLRTFGSVGSRTGQFSRPKGIALDADGNIYVADAAFGNFQIFNNEGQLLMFVGGRSNAPGPALYQLPSGIDVDEDGRVYFVDQFFRKVDVFRPAELLSTEGFLGKGLSVPSQEGVSVPSQ